MEFLVFQHVPNENLGRIAGYCEEQGIAADVIELWKPYKIPQVTEYDSLFVMPGPMAVYEDFPSKKDELAAIKLALKNNIPVLGICLGSQMLAYALGAKVYPNIINSKRVKEVGFFEVDLTDEGKRDPIFSELKSPLKVLQWHGDAFDLPNGSVKLASSKLCENQAFRFDNSYGLLFHVEYTIEMVKRQIETDREWMHKDNEVDEEEIISQAKENEKLMDKQCRRLFDNFLFIVRS